MFSDFKDPQVFGLHQFSADHLIKSSHTYKKTLKIQAGFSFWWCFTGVPMVTQGSRDFKESQININIELLHPFLVLLDGYYSNLY